MSPSSLDSSQPHAIQKIGQEAVRAHMLAQKIASFGDLDEAIREELLSELSARGILDKKSLAQKARELSDEISYTQSGMGFFSSQEEENMGQNALLDFYAANHLTPEEIDESINLVRKRKRALALKLVLDRTNPQGREVWRRLSEFCELPLGEKRIPPAELFGIRAALIENFISSHLPFMGVAKNHLTVRGICDLKPYIIGREGGVGRVGGKSAGMLLAMAILKPTLEAADPDLADVIIAPKSYYVRSDVVDAFKDANRACLSDILHHKYKDIDQITEEFPKVRQACQEADFPPDIKKKFRKMLQDMSGRPLIVRSSSYLEDNSGFAFSGKYISIFLANQGTLNQRLNTLLAAVKDVYASTFTPEVMEYRKKRGLLDYNERMCLLIQEVVGRKYGDYFFPLAAGVALSSNNYIWSPRIKRGDGLLRMVAGLGTRAVDRVGPDYPRLVPLGEPMLRPENTAPQIMKYSQRFLDAVGLKTNQLETVSLKKLMPGFSRPDLAKVASVEKGGMLSTPIGGLDKAGGRACVTFDGLIQDGVFIPVMRKVMRKLEDAFGQPIEVEFAYDQGKIFILQCRTLSDFEDRGEVDIPENLPAERILFKSSHGFASAVVEDIEYLIYVDALAYRGLKTSEQRLAAARLVGFLNRQLKDQRFVLMGPGRWGSNNLELGVKVTYADIAHARMLIELSWSKNGVLPDPSYGTHFFHDLVEGNIFPLAVRPESPEDIFDRDFFAQTPAVPPHWREHFMGLEHCVKLFHLPSLTGGLKLQVMMDGRQPLAVGYLSRKPPRT